MHYTEITGEDFTAKDFRTWLATVLACTSLRGFDLASSRGQAKKNGITAIEAVAGVLGNTRSVMTIALLRKCERSTGVARPRSTLVRICRTITEPTSSGRNLPHYRRISRVFERAS